MTHVTCRLTAKNRDQLRNPTLGNRVWATFTFLAEFPYNTEWDKDRSKGASVSKIGSIYSINRISVVRADSYYR